jgi:hypothetical protein
VRPQGGRRLPLEAQQRVRVVLHDEEIVFLSDLEELEPTLRAQGHPRRVLEVRDDVEELDALARALTRGDALAEGLGDQSVLVHRDVDDLGLGGGEGAECPHVGGRFGEHDVTGVEQDPADEVQGLLTAHGHDDVVRRGGDADEAHDLADLLTEPRVTLAAAVVQGHGTALEHELAQHLPHRIEGQRRRVWRAAGQADHLGPAGNGEQGSDLRGGHTAGARCVAPDVGIQGRARHNCTVVEMAQGRS